MSQPTEGAAAATEHLAGVDLTGLPPEQALALGHLTAELIFAAEARGYRCDRRGGEVSEWREPFLIRATGGPAAGDRVIRDGDLGLSWPLPEFLPAAAGDDGRYRKVGESVLPPQTEGSHLVRGAEYEYETRQ